MMHNYRYLILFVTILIISTSIFAATRINAVPDKSRLQYIENDPENNRVTIRISVSDTSQPVENGTPVFLTTTLGKFVKQTVYTQGGQCIAILENTESAGRATINIMCGDANSILTIEYLGIQTGPKISHKQQPYKLTANQINYSLEENTFDLIENGVLEKDNIKIEADSIVFYNEKDNFYKKIVATNVSPQKQVVLTIDGEYTFTTNELIWNPSTKNIVIRIKEPVSGYATINTETLAQNVVEIDDEEGLTDFLPPTFEKTKTFVVAKSVIMMPSEYIIFKSMKFYINSFNHAIYSFPYYYLDLRNNYRNDATFNLFNASISLTSDLGLSFNFPVNYYADQYNVGKVELSYLTPGALNLQGKPGSRVSLSHTYATANDKGKGTFSVNDALRSTRTFNLTHSQQISKLRSTVGLNYGRTLNDSPYAARINLSLYRNIGDAGLSFSSYGNKFGENEDAFMELSASLPSIVYKGYSLNYSVYTGWSDNKIVDRHGSKDIVKTYEGMRANFSIPQYKVFNGTLSPSLSNDLSIENTNKKLIQERVDASLRYSKELFFGIYSNTTYGYSFYTSNDLKAYPEKINSYVSTGLSKNTKNWNATCYGSYNIENESLNTSANLLWLMPIWKDSDGSRMLMFNYAMNSSSMKSGNVTADHIFSLSRQIGSTGIAIHYSPTGSYSVSGLGTSSGKQWSIEILRFGW